MSLVVIRSGTNLIAPGCRHVRVTAAATTVLPNPAAVTGAPLFLERAAGNNQRVNLSSAVGGVRIGGAAVTQLPRRHNGAAAFTLAFAPTATGWEAQ